MLTTKFIVVTGGVCSSLGKGVTYPLVVPSCARKDTE